MRQISSRAIALVALAVVGCEEPRSIEPPASGGGEPGYPAGPYGVEPGSIIEDASLEGFPHPDETTSELVRMSLSDFYNPTAEGLYPADSVHDPGEPKPRALLIIATMTWVPMAMEEARRLAKRYPEPEPDGVEILFVLVDGPSVQLPATEDDLRNWMNKLEVSWPAALDRSQTVRPMTTQPPTHVVIDTQTMEIVEVVSGYLRDDELERIVGLLKAVAR